MPTLFSTLTAITSTPLVIQASTTSFCFAGSRSVGPSHNNSTPSSFAASSAPCLQLTKYGSPLAFGINAITGLCPFGPGTALVAVFFNSFTSERVDHQLLPATISAATRITPLKMASCEFLKSNSSSGASRAELIRIERRSKRIVPTNRTPVRTPANSAGWPLSRRPF